MARETEEVDRREKDEGAKRGNISGKLNFGSLWNGRVELYNKKMLYSRQSFIYLSMLGHSVSYYPLFFVICRNVFYYNWQRPGPKTNPT